MKKILFLALAFFAIGCVDRDFDLGKAENNDIVFGDKFTIPLGTLKINITEFFDPGPSTKSTVNTNTDMQQILIEDKTKSFTINAKAAEAILKTLSVTESQSIEVTVTHKIPGVVFDLKLKAGNTSINVTNVKDNTAKFTINITIDELLEIVNAPTLDVEFKVVSGGGVVTVKKSELLEIGLKLQIKGGIKL